MSERKAVFTIALILNIVVWILIATAGWSMWLDCWGAFGILAIIIDAYDDKSDHRGA